MVPARLPSLIRRIPAPSVGPEPPDKLHGSKTKSWRGKIIILSSLGECLGSDARFHHPARRRSGASGFISAPSAPALLGGKHEAGAAWHARERPVEPVRQENGDKRMKSHSPVPILRSNPGSSFLPRSKAVHSPTTGTFEVPFADQSLPTRLDFPRPPRTLAPLVRPSPGWMGLEETVGGDDSNAV